MNAAVSNFKHILNFLTKMEQMNVVIFKVDKPIMNYVDQN